MEQFIDVHVPVQQEEGVGQASEVPQLHPILSPFRLLCGDCFRFHGPNSQEIVQVPVVVPQKRRVEHSVEQIVEVPVSATCSKQKSLQKQELH